MPATSANEISKMVESLVTQLGQKTINLANVNTMLSSIKSLAQIAPFNATLMSKLLDQMNAAAKVITDSKTLTALLDTISELTKNQLQTQTTTNVTAANKLQLQTINSLGSAAESSAKMLSASNPTSTFSAGGITGMNKLVDPKELANNTSIKL